MKTEKSNNAHLPYLVIGIVGVLIVIGLVWWLQNRQAAPQKAQSGTLKSNINTALASAPAGANPPNFRGAANSPIVLEEFADYQCPTCAKVHPVLSQIASEYGSRIKFVYRSFPLTSIHDKSYDAAVAAEAAGLQGKFWDMQNQLFQNQSKWSSSMDHRTLFADYAKLIGLDVEKFKTDSAGLLTKSRVDADLARASAARLSGTPSLFLNGSPIDVAQISVDRLRSIIEEELKRFQAAQSQGSAPQK